MKQSLLIVTNGSPESLPAVEYGLWLAQALPAAVTLLGALDHAQHKPAIDRAFQVAEERLRARQPGITRIIEPGDPARLACQTVQAGQHLVILGPMARPGRPRGGALRFLLKYIQAPLIYAPQLRQQMKEILLCTGGLGYIGSAEQWAHYLAQRTGASLTILHIVEPTFYDYPVTHQIQVHWEKILQTDTPQGRNLRQAVQKAQEAGIPARVKIRHGDIIHEINAEIHERDYDLVAMGSSAGAHGLRHLYKPNVTVEIVEKSHLPVLVARLGQEPILES